MIDHDREQLPRSAAETTNDLTFLRLLHRDLTEATAEPPGLIAIASEIPTLLWNEGYALALAHIDGAHCVHLSAMSRTGRVVKIEERQPMTDDPDADHVALWTRTLTRLIAWWEEANTHAA